jgi:hypothetical protein
VEPATTDAGTSTMIVRGDVGAIVCEVLAVHPAGLVTVTEYVFVAPAETGTVIDGVVAPVDQRYVEMFVPLAVSVTLPPVHELVGPLIETVGAGFTVTVVGADVPAQLPLPVTVTL